MGRFGSLLGDFWVTFGRNTEEYEKQRSSKNMIDKNDVVQINVKNVTETYKNMSGRVLETDKKFCASRLDR